MIMYTDMVRPRNILYTYSYFILSSCSLHDHEKHDYDKLSGLIICVLGTYKPKALDDLVLRAAGTSPSNDFIAHKDQIETEP